MSPTTLKLPLSFEDQAKKLLARGIVDCSQYDLENFLQKNNYYRLNAYFHDEIDPKTDKFSKPFSFITLQNRYLIDAWLRRIIMLSIEPIEIKLRTMLAYWSAITTGADTFYHKANYLNEQKWSEVYNSFEKVNRGVSVKTDPVVSHHNQKYGGKFPFWVVVEYLSLGNLSKLLRNSQHNVQNKVAFSFNELAKPLVISWIHSSSVLRNIAAHYGYLYNRCFSVLPQRAYWESYTEFSNNRKLFPYLLVVKYLSEPDDWDKIRNILIKRIREAEDFNFLAYGFPPEWEKYL
jgi:abortive infection bacteriophage resistance protein